MKRSLRILIFLAALGLASHSPASAQSATVRTLTRLEDEWGRAMVRNDAAFFRRILAPNFVYTEDAVVMSKDELIKALTTSGDTVTSATNEDMRVRLHGSTAIVTGILAVNGRGKTGPFSRRYRFTDVWQQQGGRWRVIAAQDYLMPR